MMKYNCIFFTLFQCPYRIKLYFLLPVFFLNFFFKSSEISGQDRGDHFRWGNQIGNQNQDFGSGMTSDGLGNVYVTGSFSETIDANPGSGVLNLTSTGNIDVFFGKYDANGKLLWAKSVGGPGVDYGYSIAVDKDFNVFVAGTFQNTGDFDPGPGVENLNSSGSSDVYICKFNALGDLVWAKNVGGVGTDGTESITIDFDGYLYITGTFQSTVDFDAGPGITNLSSNGGFDVFLLKYSNSGDFVWAKGIGGSDEDDGNLAVLDELGNVYVTGFYSSTADFDPGPGTSYLTPSGSKDVFFGKYDKDGNYQWAKSFGGSGVDLGYSIVLDKNKNIYVVGYFSDIVDFDPGPGNQYLSSQGDVDIFLTKYNNNGDLIWANTMGGIMGDYGYHLATDTSNFVYITGKFQTQVDFDPGSGISILSSLGDWDIYLAKYDLDGNYVWANSTGSSSYFDLGRMVMPDNHGNIYLIGSFQGSVDFDFGNEISLFTSSGGFDIFFAKYGDSIGIYQPLSVYSPSDTLNFNTVGVTLSLDSTATNLPVGAQIVVIDYNEPIQTDYVPDSIATVFDDNYWNIETNIDTFSGRICFKFDTSIHTSFIEYLSLVFQADIDLPCQLIESIPEIGDSTICFVTNHFSNWSIAIVKPEAKIAIDTILNNTSQSDQPVMKEFQGSGATMNFYLSQGQTDTVFFRRYDINPGGKFPPRITSFLNNYWELRSKNIDTIGLFIEMKSVSGFSIQDTGKFRILHRSGPLADWEVLSSFRIRKGLKESVFSRLSGNVSGHYIIGITDTVIPAFSMAVSIQDSCAGSNSILEATLKNGTPPFTYSWSGQDSLSGNSSRIEHSYPSNGSFGFTLVIQDGTGAIIEFTDTVTIGCTGISFENKMDQPFASFPNPVTDGLLQLKINAINSGPITFHITDLLGKTIYKYSKNSDTGAMSLDIPVSSLNTGIYFLNVKSGNSSTVQKILIR